MQAGGGRPSAPRGLSREDRDAYWRINLRIVGALLLVWFLVSYGAGILWADALNSVRIPGSGFRLGFWFAQQGSIYVFVVLIFTYVVLMNRLDRRFGVREEGPVLPGVQPDLEDPEGSHP